MRASAGVLAGFGLLAASIPAAAAACSDEIAALTQQLDAKDKDAIAATSGGQKDAAARGGLAQEAAKTGTPVRDLPHPPGAGAAAGNGGAGVMAAKVSLNDARNAEKKGDETACMAAIGTAKRLMNGDH